LGELFFLNGQKLTLKKNTNHHAKLLTYLTEVRHADWHGLYTMCIEWDTASQWSSSSHTDWMSHSLWLFHPGYFTTDLGCVKESFRESKPHFRAG